MFKKNENYLKFNKEDESMKKIIPIVFFLFISSFLFAQAGTLDPTFGTDGIAIFGFSPDHDVGYDIIALDDGSMLVCGVYEPDGYMQGFDGLILKLQPDGSLDTTFGEDGITYIEFGLDSYVYQMELLPDGKVIVSGLIYFEEYNAELFVARYLSDGIIDTTFGTDGYTVGDYSTEDDYAWSMLIQDDGSIVLGGRTESGDWSSMLFARFTADGVLDSTFGTNGYTLINESSQDESIRDMAFLNDGTIVAVGDGYVGNPEWGHMARMVKLDSNGNPITTFGNNGVLVPPIFTDGSVAYAVQIDDDDVFVTGYVYGQTQGTDLFVTKLDDEGNADPDFGTDGLFIAPLNPDYYNNIGLDILITSDEYIYVCGSAGASSFTLDFIVLRCTMNGVLDPEFNGTGYNVTQIGIDFEEANAMDMQADGKIVLAGFKADFTAANDIVVSRYFTSDAAVLNPPTNLAVTSNPEDDFATFTWEVPATDDLTGYDVYLDEVFQGNTTNLEWVFEDLECSIVYEAGVVAVYDEGDSEMATVEFTFEGTDAGNDLINKNELIGNYPNPFNPITTITFSLTTEITENTELIIYNLKGQKVKTFLINSSTHQPINLVVWNGTDESEKPVSSGIYFNKLKNGNFEQTKKMILMK